MTTQQNLGQQRLSVYRRAEGHHHHLHLHLKSVLSLLFNELSALGLYSKKIILNKPHGAK